MILHSLALLPLSKRLKMSDSVQSSFAHTVSLAGVHSWARFATSCAVCPSDLRGKAPAVCVCGVCWRLYAHPRIHSSDNRVMWLTCTRCFQCPEEKILCTVLHSWSSLRPCHWCSDVSIWALILKWFNHCWNWIAKRYLPFSSSSSSLLTLQMRQELMFLCFCELCTALGFI